MWVLIIFALFATGVCIAAFIRGASTVSAHEHGLLDARTEIDDRQHRDAA